MPPLVINSVLLPFLLIGFLVGLIIRWRLSLQPPPGLKRLPGPWGLPYIGRIHDVDPERPWFKLKEFADKYGPIFQQRIMGHEHVWLASADLAHDFMAKRSNIYSDKHDIPVMSGVKERAQYLPLLGYNEDHRRHRKFSTIVMTEAHNAGYYDYPVLEAKRLLAKLLEDPEDYMTLIDRYTGRITCRLAWGDPEQAIFIRENAALFLHDISPGGPAVNAIEPLRFLPEWLVTSKKNERLRNKAEGEMFLSQLNKVRQRMAEGTAGPSYARTYLERQAAWGFKDDEEAAFAVGMGSNVGIHTISSPLTIFLLAMLLHQDCQAVLRKELDDVLGERMIQPSDSIRLPYLRACILECMRWRPPVPLNPPRPAMKADTYAGYHIPKGAYVHAIEWAIARDPKRYPDPDVFNPDRWVNPEYPTFKAPLTEYPTIIGHHQFSYGKRACLGQQLGQAELLIACGAIIWAFNVVRKRDSNGDLVPVPDYDFATLPFNKPFPFAMDLNVRSQQRANLIMKQFRDSDNGVQDMQV